MELLSVMSYGMKCCLHKIKWRIKNKHNYTTASNYFPIDNVCVGKGTYGPIRVMSFVYGDANLRIGNFCSIAKGVTFLLGGEHDMGLLSTYPFESYYGGKSPNTCSKGDIILGDDVWMGYNSTVLSGVTIGQGAVVASGAVVAGNVPPYSIVGGVPAKVLGYRFEETIRKKMEEIDYSCITWDMYKQHEGMFHEKITEDNVDDIIQNIKTKEVKERV